MWCWRSDLSIEHCDIIVIIDNKKYSNGRNIENDANPVSMESTITNIVQSSLLSTTLSSTTIVSTSAPLEQSDTALSSSNQQSKSSTTLATINSSAPLNNATWLFSSFVETTTSLKSETSGLLSIVFFFDYNFFSPQFLRNRQYHDFIISIGLANWHYQWWCLCRSSYWYRLFSASLISSSCRFDPVAIKTTYWYYEL